MNWTEQEVQKLKELWEQSPTATRENYERIGKAIGRSGEAVRKKLKRMGLVRVGPSSSVAGTATSTTETDDIWAQFIEEEFEGEETPAPHLETKKKFDETDEEKLFDLLVELQGQARAEDQRLEEHRVRVYEDDWFGIVFSGDWHLEATGSRPDLLREDLKYIASVPHVYYIFCGDGGHNFIAGGPHMGGQHETLLPPRLARRLLTRLFSYLGPKLLALCTGDHDSWSIDVDDYDLIQEIARNHPNAAYLGFGARLQIRTLGRTFKAVIRHRGQGTSIYNPFHPCFRELHFQNPDADLVVIAHNHESGCEVFPKMGKLRFLARTGTYMPYDRYGNKLGYAECQYHMEVPIALLDPQTGAIQGALGIRPAIDMLMGLRAGRRLSGRTA